MDGIRNVVLITVDCLRADHLPSYGYERDTAPFLDGLAEESTVYENAIAAGCGTPASFPSILSSTFPFDYGGYNGIADERPYLPELVSDADVTTGGFHSNTYLTEAFGYGRGFDEFESFRSDDADEPDAATRISRSIDHDSVLYRMLRRLHGLISMPTNSAPYLPADDLTDRVKSWVSDRRSPFFLWTHYMDPHAPHQPPSRHYRRFGDDAPTWNSHQQQWRDAVDEPSAVDSHSREQFIDAYDAEIRFVDEQLERLFETFESTGAYEETLFLITADHGEGFGEHGFYGHPPGVFEELVHVPLMVHDPRDGETRRVDDPVSLLSIAPTVLDGLGVEPPSSFRDTSLLDRAGTASAGVFSEVCEEAGGGFEIQPYDRSRAIVGYRTSRFKYVRDRQSDCEALYDLHEDPGERTDRSDDHPDRLERARDRVERHLDDVRPAESEHDVSVTADVAERMAELGYVEE